MIGEHYAEWYEDGTTLVDASLARVADGTRCGGESAGCVDGARFETTMKPSGGRLLLDDNSSSL